MSIFSVAGVALPFAVGYLLALVTWLFYLAAMNLLRHKDAMHPVAKLHAYALVAVGVVLDALLNAIVATVLFLDPPRDALLTGRLRRYINDPKERPWRRRVAKWVCVHLLDQFDPTGDHCKE
jgi:hypothetical protein